MAQFALTFDDGPGPITSSLLDLLGQYQVKATFFVLGRNGDEALWCNGDRKTAIQIVARALREGHVVGNHSYSHLRNADMSVFAKDIKKCDDFIQEAQKMSGLNPQSIPCRLPYGIQPVAGGDPRLVALASMGRPHVSWTKILKDYEMKSADQGAVLCQEMLDHIKLMFDQGLNAVFTLHDSCAPEEAANGYGRDATLKAVELFLEEAKAKKWSHFVTPAF